jgi:predicted metal-dependent HD superfamily phosphohydrolase
MISPQFPLSKLLWKKARPAYEKPERTYHNEAYIVEGFKKLTDIYVKPSLAQELAWIAHRVVNDPDSTKNTPQNVKWMQDAFRTAKLNAGEKMVVQEAVEIVESLEHYVAKTPSAIPVIDVALQRLGNDWNTFSHYAWCLKDEAPDLPVDEWIHRSQTFAQQLLAKEAIFQTPEAHRRWERRVRENLMLSIQHHPLTQGRLFDSSPLPKGPKP